MRRRLEPGDVVRQASNGTRWLIYMVDGTQCFGECIDPGFTANFGAYAIGFNEMPFDRLQRDHGVSLVDADDIPEEMWPRIAMLRMGVEA